MESKTIIPSEGQKAGKMKNRFLLRCIIPATLVLGIVCGISIYFSRLMACQNMYSAMQGQQNSKLSLMQGHIDEVMGKNSEYSTMICNSLEAVESPDQFGKVIGDINTAVNSYGNVSSSFSFVKIALFNQQMIIGNRGYSKSLSELTESCEWSELSWYDEARIRDNETYVYKSSEDANFSGSLFTYVIPVYSNKSGNCVGAFLISTNNDAFTPMIQMTTNIKEQIWFILDDNNELYYYSNGGGISNMEALAEEAADFDNTSLYISFNGKQYIMRTNHMPGMDGFRIVYTIPIDPIIQQSRTTTYLSVIICVISIILIILFVLTLSAQIVREINDVRKSVKGIYENDFSEPIAAKNNDEMGQLVHEFNGVIEKLKYQAEHDGKTHYYNGETFAKKSVEYISKNHERSYAIVRVDIDNFSFVNDIFDWEVGDNILLGIAGAIKEVFGEDSVLGYLGNDIFVICTGYVFREAVVQKIERANEKIKASAEKYMPITPHFGICENAEADMDISILCDYAGIALKTVKGNLLQTYAIYDEKFDENHKVQKFVESNKIAALENNDFYILLQPKCEIFSGKVVGAEALVRWRDHTSGEIISPGKFIPIFEKNGFVITLDRFVWEETCKVVKKWRDLGYRDIPVSVNVSRMHIMHDSFVEDFAALVNKYEIPPHLIEVEITESALLENSEDALQEVMMGLKNKGFKLLMDDFASGYSSLIALQRLPFDVIKIDKGLIDKIGEGFNRQFVAGIIAFLREIKKDIVIEGVEYDWQKEILKETGGRVIQGFCFSRPIAVEDFEKMAFSEETDDK